MSQQVSYDSILQRVIEYTRVKNFSSSEISDSINDAYREYWNLINETSENYNIKTGYFVTDGSTTLYTLAPTDGDFFKLRGCDYDVSNVTTQNSTQRVTLRAMNWNERNLYRNYPLFTGTPVLGSGLVYMMWGADQLLLQPLPSANLTIVYYYWPVMPTLASGSYVNGINGLDVYISARAAKTVLDSRQQPSQWLDAKIASFIDMLKTTAGEINRDEPPRIQDMRAKSSGWWY